MTLIVSGTTTSSVSGYSKRHAAVVGKNTRTMADEKPPVSPPTSGVFITKGMRVGFPPGSFTLSIGQGGKLEATTNPVLHATLEMAPFWLEIAWTHLQVAEEEHPKLEPAWQRQDIPEIQRLLEVEFVACMQASVATAIAYDAFYSAVKDRIEVPGEVLKAWRDKGIDGGFDVIHLGRLVRST